MLPRTSASLVAGGARSPARPELRSIRPSRCRHWSFGAPHLAVPKAGPGGSLTAEGTPLTWLKLIWSAGRAARKKARNDS